MAMVKGNTTDEVNFKTAAPIIHVIVARRKKIARLELKVLKRSMFQVSQIT